MYLSKNDFKIVDKQLEMIDKEIDILLTKNPLDFLKLEILEKKLQETRDKLMITLYFSKELKIDNKNEKKS